MGIIGGHDRMLIDAGGIDINLTVAANTVNAASAANRFRDMRGNLKIGHLSRTARYRGRHVNHRYAEGGVNIHLRAALTDTLDAGDGNGR